MYCTLPRSGAGERATPLRTRLAKLERAFLRQHLPVVLGAVAATLAQAALVVPIPYWQGLVIDRLVGRGQAPAAADDYRWLLLFAAILPLVCLALRLAMGWLAGQLMSRVSLEFVRSLTDSVHRKLQRLPVSYFDKSETGQLMARLTADVGTLLIFLNTSSVQLVADLVLAAGIVVVLAWLSWPLALTSLLALPLFFWNYRRSAERIGSLSRRLQDQNAQLYAYLSERMSAVRSVRAFGASGQELTAYTQQLDEQSRAARDTLRSTSLQNALAALVAGLAAAVLVCLAAVLVRAQWISLGSAVAFTAYLALLYQPLVRLTQFYGGIAATLAAVERITEVLEEPEPPPPRRQRFPRRVRGDLRLRSVSFRYEAGGPLVLDAINLHIEPGSTVGIWGASGAGKSTLLALLPRLYDLAPGHGRILLDGRDLRTLRSADLRRSVLLVPQQARLFAGTLRSNLTYAAHDASDGLLRQAVAAVDLTELVESLPQGLQTPVGERGATLSGGQRQRLALARALIARPPVLLLDDCTSALDTQTEARVWERMGRIRPLQTRVIVSNKLESLAGVDWLVILEAGRIACQGSPHKVLPHSPAVALAGKVSS